MQTLTIGRSSSNNIVLNDSMVSRTHAQIIIMDNGQVMIKDSGSSNGTFVNGNRITESYLKPGDIVKCGGTFLDWTNYLRGKVSMSAQRPEQHYNESYNQQFNQDDSGSETSKGFSLGETLRYLMSRCLDTEDLFKTEWDRVPSIMFFILLPLGLSLGVLLYYYSSVQNSFFHQQNDFIYIVLYPLITIFLIFGVSQFLTLTLLSINRDTSFNKNLFASSIYSFLQFLNVLFSFGIAYFISSNINNSRYSDSIPAYFILCMVLITIVIIIFISLIIFLYNYFRGISVSKSVSIHFVIISLTLNLLIQAALIYLFFSIIKNNSMPYKIF